MAISYTTFVWLKTVMTKGGGLRLAERNNRRSIEEAELSVDIVSLVFELDRKGVVFCSLFKGGQYLLSLVHDLFIISDSIC